MATMHRSHVERILVDSGCMMTPCIAQTRRLMIVDDSEFDLEAMVIIAESMGWCGGRLCPASNQADAIEIVRAGRVDLAVIDYHLGQYDTGLPIIRELMESNPHAICIVLTGASSDSSVVCAAMDAGARLVCSKRLGTRDAFRTAVAVLTVLEVSHA